MKKVFTMILMSIMILAFAFCNGKDDTYNRRLNTMEDFIGTWVFHSIMGRDEQMEIVWLTAEEYLEQAKTDTPAEDLEHELKERKLMTGMQLRVLEDGRILSLTAIPDGIPQEEVDKAVAAGLFTLVDGMMYRGEDNHWEIRDGEVWADTGVAGEVFGEKTDGWERLFDDEGHLTLVTMRFVKQSK